MTTEFRAAPSRPRVGQRSSNFHEPVALDSYASHFQRIGIASVAASAAQLKPTPSTTARTADANAAAMMLRWDDDAA